MKVAKLVRVVLISRVIVDENADNEAAYAAAKSDLIEQAKAHYGESLDSVEDDKECPYTEEEGQ